MVIHDDIALLTQIHFVIIFITSKCWWIGLSAKKNDLLVTKKNLTEYDFDTLEICIFMKFASQEL